MPITPPSPGGTGVLTPLTFYTDKTTITTADPDQTIVQFIAPADFWLTGFSVYAYDRIATGWQVLFGECSLETDWGKIYTAPLSSLNNGFVLIQFSYPLFAIPQGQIIKITCSPEAPIGEQVWRANIMGLTGQ
jgi:hypothetical protein